MRHHAITALLLLAAAATPAETVVRGDGVIDATVNDVPVRLRIDPGAPGIVTLAPEPATRAALKAGGLLGFSVVYHVGTQRVIGKTTVARFAIDGSQPAKRRLAWTGLPRAAGVDAVMGPAGLEEPVVRFILRPSVPGERTVSLPMAPTGTFFGSWYGLRAQLTLAGAPLLVRFDPHHRRTIATAVAAQRLAAMLGGTLNGPAVPEEIAFGIERPVRTMMLARPLTIGPLALTTLGVRVSEPGSTATLPEAGAPSPAIDPDEVVVIAKKGKARAATMALGADALARCSQIVFDKPAKVIRLTCL